MSDIINRVIGGIYAASDREYVATSQAEVSAPRVMLSFGEFEFSLDTVMYNQLSRSASWRWAEQPLIGKGDLLQYTGKAARTVTLTGIEHAAYRNGVGAVDDLYDLADMATPQILVSAAGDVFGYWVATDFSEEITSFTLGGGPRKRSYKLELKYYGEKLSN